MFSGKASRTPNEKEEEERKCLEKLKPILEANKYSLEKLKTIFFQDITSNNINAVRVARELLRNNLSEKMINCNYLKREIDEFEVENANDDDVNDRFRFNNPRQARPTIRIGLMKGLDEVDSYVDN